MTSATDVVRARDELFEMFAADRRSRDPYLTGIKRMQGHVYMAGPGNVGYDHTDDAQRPRESLSTCMAAALLAGLTEARPELAAVNYYVAPALHDTLVGIADALPDDTLHDDAPPPSAAGFAMLGTPWRWTDPWGHEHTVEAVSWGPGVLPIPGDETTPGITLRPTFVGLWTRLRSSNYDYMVGVIENGAEYSAAQARYEAFGRHGWMLTRVTSLFWERERPPEVEPWTLGPQRFEMTDAERAAALDGSDNLPLISTSNYNAGRLVHALFLVLAGAQHVPGSTRDPVLAVELPNRTRTKVARRHKGSALVSMVYAGAERPATPRENVGTRGPIGVRYWRQPYTRRRRGADGMVRIETVRGAWCGDPDAPLSPYTKVRIAKGTVARPADVIREEAS